MDDNTIKCLLKLIEEQLGWGEPETWASRDFEELNVLIQERTKVSISSSTLRRLWGKADYNNQPSLTTLDTLARFAGFKNWKNFNHTQQPVSQKGEPAQPVIIKKQWLIAAAVLAGAIAAFVIIIPILRNSNPKHGSGNYAFNTHPITHDLPNTVVFTYNAQSAATDSVFIQQSWDSTKKVRVNKNSRVFNSIYYKPGFYHAKLSIGNQVVKEHPLLIPTNGWLGLIDQNPIPVYLNKTEFITAKEAIISSATIASHHFLDAPQPPTVELYNTGNFKPVSILDFSFSAEVKDDFKTGAARCQEINIILYTDDIPISIPLSAPGCVAALNLLDGHREFKGALTDLTAFGIDPSNWVAVGLISHDGRLKVMINGKTAFTIDTRGRSSKILGLGFIFQGTADIRKVNLASGTQKVFSDFN